MCVTAVDDKAVVDVFCYDKLYGYTFLLGEGVDFAFIYFFDDAKALYSMLVDHVSLVVLADVIGRDEFLHGEACEFGILMFFVVLFEVVESCSEIM